MGVSPVALSTTRPLLQEDFIAERAFVSTVRHVSKTNTPRTRQGAKTSDQAVTSQRPRPRLRVVVVMSNSFCRNGVLSALAQLGGLLDIYAATTTIEVLECDVIVTTPAHVSNFEEHPCVLLVADAKHQSGSSFLIEGPEQLVGAIGALVADYTAVPTTLTARESEILALVATGATTNEIAEAIFMSPDTVKSYLARIYRKLGVHDRAAAVYRAVTAGLLATTPLPTPTAPLLPA